MDDSMVEPQNVWVIGPVPIMTDQGAAELAGWVRGQFALDYRPARGEAAEEGHTGVWTLTHLPTGWKVCDITGLLDEAKGFVALLEAGGDWSFTNATDASDMKKIFADARAAFGSESIWRGRNAITPPVYHDAAA